MAVDMKGMMADAVEKLLFEKNKKKITVKDIVEECSITRQAFYYHFADIPELLHWMISRKADQALQEAEAVPRSPEEMIRYWILIGINGKKQMKKSVESNYGEEISRIVFEEMVGMFAKLVELRPGAEAIDPLEKRIIIRYHCHAVMGILQDWTDADSENLDRIVHNIYLIVTGRQKELFDCNETNVDGSHT